MLEDMQIYYSVDKTNTDNVASSYKEFSHEYLQSISFSGLLSAELQLKVKALIILLQNLYLQEGLYNSTCLVITHLYRYLIQEQVLTSTQAGIVHLILQIDLSSAEGELAFILTHQQFPVQLCFTIMINKSQGQSL